GRVNEVVRLVNSQENFDELFNFLLHHERLLVMRSADAIEKITSSKPEWLAPHKKQLLAVLRGSVHKELKWHLALLIARIPLTQNEFVEVWDVLSYWARNPHESRIVRANALQGLFDMSRKAPDRRDKLAHLLDQLQHESIPS